MCSIGTSSPSLEQTPFCWIRAPSLSCSWWNRTSFWDVAVKSLIGTLTRPKLMAPLQMALGIIETYLLANGTRICALAARDLPSPIQEEAGTQGPAFGN